MSHATFGIGLFLLTALTAGCGGRRIPGTDIEDNGDTRAILQVMEQYRAAVEAKDAPKVLSLLDPSFRDNAGNSDPSDDLDYQGVGAVLAEQFQKVEDIKLEMSIRKIVVEPDQTARAIYSYTSSYRLPRLSAKPQSEADLKQMTFRRAEGDWKITSGI